MILSEEEINDVWGKIEVTRFTHPDADKPDFQFFDQGIYGEAIAKAQLKKVVPDVEEVIRVLGKVVPNDQNAMIEWAVKSQDSVYTNAGAAYRLLLELRQALLEEVKG